VRDDGEAGTHPGRGPAREWQATGVWERLHRLMLDELSDAEVLEWSRGCIDSLSVRAESACAAK
jgi:hypothetical protein